MPELVTDKRAETDKSGPVAHEAALLNALRSAQRTSRDFSLGYVAGLCLDIARNTTVSKMPRVVTYRFPSSSGSLAKSLGSLMACGASLLMVCL